MWTETDFPTFMDALFGAMEMDDDPGRVSVDSDGEPNPFCSNRSEQGDACGACAGCIAEGARLRARLDAETQR